MKKLLIATILALCVALPVHARQTLTSADIRDNAIVDNDLAPGSVGPLQIQDNSILASDLVQAVLNEGGWYKNLSIVSATTTDTGDSIRLAGANGNALSSSNPGVVVLPSTGAAGQTTVFTLTSDITIKVTGAHYGWGGTGNITGGILRVLHVNDNGSHKLCIALLGGRHTLLTTDTTATQTSVTSQEHVLCNSAVGSSSNTVREFGYARGDFNDTGDVWANQTSVGDIVTGQSADGLWQPWNPAFTGFSANPSGGHARWTQQGRTVLAFFGNWSSGTSNATTFTITAPAKTSHAQYAVSCPFSLDNGVNEFSTAEAIMVTAGSTTITMARVTGGSGWTASGGKNVVFTLPFQAGPVASFIE